MKKVDRNGVEKCGWGMVGFCSSVRSTLLLVPNPQEDKKENGKKIDCERFSVETNSGIPREQNRELTTT